jgi:predicted phosphodiesterase|nr:MAG TPA: metallophosphatase domain protein [Caudoviricetes sp.]
METKELCEKIKILLKKKKGFVDICKELQLKDYEVIGLVNLMKQDGELIDYVNGELVRLKTPPKTNDIYQVSTNSTHIPLLLISDTHLCSKYDRLDILRYLYDKAEDRGIKYILHSGDFTDGRSNRPEHIYELKETSYEGQVDYCVDKYPTFSGKTYVISGNHDDWWYKSTGSEIVKAIAKRRDDIVYLGSDVADLKIGKLKIRLFHGKGGNAYAKSYKVQKYLDSIPLEERPHILQTGHVHQSFYMKQDDTHCFQTSCLEDLTPFARSMGLANDKSVWWVDVNIDDRGKIESINQELETFNTKKLVRRK